jgi:hypothetical protein
VTPGAGGAGDQGWGGGHWGRLFPYQVEHRLHDVPAADLSDLQESKLRISSGWCGSAPKGNSSPRRAEPEPEPEPDAPSAPPSRCRRHRHRLRCRPRRRWAPRAEARVPGGTGLSLAIGPLLRTRDERRRRLLRYGCTCLGRRLGDPASTSAAVPGPLRPAPQTARSAPCPAQARWWWRRRRQWRR